MNRFGFPVNCYRTVHYRLVQMQQKMLDPVFAERLTGLMKERGLNQVAVARACGWASPVVNRYCGGRIPKAENLEKLAAVLGVSMEWLLHGTGEKSTAAPPIPKESKGEEYWRNQAIAAQRRVVELERQIEQLIRGPVTPPSLSAQIPDFLGEAIVEIVDERPRRGAAGPAAPESPQSDPPRPRKTRRP